MISLSHLGTQGNVRVNDLVQVTMHDYIRAYSFKTLKELACSLVTSLDHIHSTIKAGCVSCQMLHSQYE